MYLNGIVPTKEKIYREAVKLFYEEGFINVSLRQIARNVGIAHNTILHYYGSKDGLANIIRLRHRQLILNEAVKVYAAIEDTEKKPIMGMLAYHSLLFKHFYTDKRFGKIYCDFRIYAGETFLHTYGAEYLFPNLSSVFPGIKFVQDKDARDLGLNISNECIRILTSFLIKDIIDIKKAICDYSYIYTYFLLMDKPLDNAFIVDFYDKHISAYELDAEKIFADLILESIF